MGAPGSYYWTGTVKVFNMTSNTHYNLNQDNLSPRRYSYLGNTCSDINNRFNIPCCSQSVTDLCFLGYAVTAGHFSSPNTIDVAAGAPQDSGGGKVSGSCRNCIIGSRLCLHYTHFDIQNYIVIHILGLHLQNRRNVSCEDL